MCLNFMYKKQISISLLKRIALPSLKLWSGDFWTKRYSEKLAACKVNMKYKFKNVYLQVTVLSKILQNKYDAKETHTCTLQNPMKMIFNDNSLLYLI